MSTSRSSKFVLVAASFLTAYALLAIVALHLHGHHNSGQQHGEHDAHRGSASPSLSHSESHHHGKHHGGHGFHGKHEHGEHHKTCGPKALAWVALLTGVTGIFAGASPRSRRTRCYIAMLFVFELIAFVGALHVSRAHLFKCQMDAVKVPMRLDIVEVQVGNVAIVAAKQTQGTPFVDKIQESNCAHHVRHAVVMSCVFMAVIFGGLFGCAARLLKDNKMDEAEEQRAIADAMPSPWTEVVCVATPDEPVKVAAGEESFQETDRMIVVESA